MYSPAELAETGGAEGAGDGEDVGTLVGAKVGAAESAWHTLAPVVDVSNPVAHSVQKIAPAAYRKI